MCLEMVSYKKVALAGDQWSVFPTRLIHDFLMNQTNDSGKGHKKKKPLKIVRKELFSDKSMRGINRATMVAWVDENEEKPRVKLLGIGLFAHVPVLLDVQLLVKPTKRGLSILIPKWCPWNTTQLQRVYKKPDGSIEIEFVFQEKLVIRRERKLRPEECLLEYKPD